MSKVVNNEIQANSLADNKTQAKIPEVGDVWYILGSRIYITDVYNDFVEAIKQLHYDCYRDREYIISHLLQEGKYLGKSKVNISDLFKTENE